MEIYLIDFKGNQNQLPVLLWWNFSYGYGLPCDAFEIGFIYDKKMLNMLSDTVRLRAVFEDETVFLVLWMNLKFLYLKAAALFR